MIILKRFEDNLVRISYSLKDYDIVNFLYLLILNRVQDFNHSSSRKEPKNHPIDQVEKGIHVSSKKRKSTKIKYAGLALLAVLGLLVAYHMMINLDNTPPVVKSVNYEKNLRIGNPQTFIVQLLEKNPAKSIQAVINGSIIQLSLKEYDDKTSIATYTGIIDLSKISQHEGVFIGEIIAKDKNGNIAKVPIKFYGNLREPDIKSAYFINAGNGSYILNVIVTDENIEKVLFEYTNGSIIALKIVAIGSYAHIFPISEISGKVVAIDKFNLSSTKYIYIKPGFADKFSVWVMENNLDWKVASKLVNAFPKIFEELYNKNPEALKEVISYSQNNVTLGYLILDQIKRDYRIANKTDAIQLIFDGLEKIKMGNLTMQLLYTLLNSTYVLNKDGMLEKFAETVIQTLEFIKRYHVKTSDINISEIHAIMVKILYYVPEMVNDSWVNAIAKKVGINADYLKGLLVKGGANQVYWLLYFDPEGFPPVVKKSFDEKAWKEFISIALRHGMQYMAEGFPQLSINGRLKEKDIIYRIGLILLPDSLVTFDFDRRDNCLPSYKVGVKNVQIEDSIRKILIRDFLNPNSYEYKESITSIWFSPISNWPHSAHVFQGYGKYRSDLQEVCSNI